MEPGACGAARTTEPCCDRKSPSGLSTNHRMSNAATGTQLVGMENQRQLPAQHLAPRTQNEQGNQADRHCAAALSAAHSAAKWVSPESNCQGRRVASGQCQAQYQEHCLDALTGPAERKIEKLPKKEDERAALPVPPHPPLRHPEVR